MAARATRPRTGWRGPNEPGEFPTLGWLVGEWIEEYCIIPDGSQRGAPYILTREMWRHLLNVYRLSPRAKVHPKYPRPVDGFVYYGSQLRRPQKFGKDPFMAVRAIAHALGPVQFDGWDADGEPAGRPVATPWVQVAATSETQTGNTWKPIYRNLSEGPLADTPGLDVGETRIKLPDGDGWLEYVTAEARSRLGAPITFATFTEPHLMTDRDGGRPMVRAMKRNLGGMGGSWTEGTNAWDPSEDSAAQTTAEAKAPGVYLDHRCPDLPRLTAEEFADDKAVLERIVVKYGDSCRRAGGWVDERGILALVRDPATGETEARRYFLDEVTVGERDAVNALRWAELARPAEQLMPGTAVALGFDGSRSRDATALIACRVEDGRWFRLGLWDPARYGGRVPPAVVDEAVATAMAGLDVWHLIADPYLWQTSIDTWAGRYRLNRAGKPVVVEFPTNVERRMDAAIELFLTAFRMGEGEFTHDGNPDVTRHALNAALAYGSRKAPREDGEARVSAHYLKVVKKKQGWLIDAFVAGLLATWGRGLAIEHGALADPVAAEPVFAFVDL